MTIFCEHCEGGKCLAGKALLDVIQLWNLTVPAGERGGLREDTYLPDEEALNRLGAAGFAAEVLGGQVYCRAGDSGEEGASCRNQKRPGW